MKILYEIISTLNTDTTVREIRQGIFHTGVLTRHCGLAATLPRDALKQEPPMVKEAGFLKKKPVSELVRLAASENLLEAAIGMATINSLLSVDESVCIERNAADLILEKGGGKRVVIVGYFPFVPKIRAAAKQLRVIDKNPKAGDTTEADAARSLAEADVAGITGSAFTNHTILHLLECSGPDTYVVVLGDTAPLSPVLFDYGVDAVCGTRVDDPETALSCISQGANFRQIRGTRRLTLLR